MSDVQRFTPRDLACLLSAIEPRDFSVRVGGDAVVQPGEGEPCRFTLVFESAAAAARALSRCDAVSLGAAYIDGEIDVEGDIEAALKVVYHLLSRAAPAGARGEAGASGQGASERIAARRDGGGAALSHARMDVNHHYDLPCEFWRLWLDPTMLYTCAYFSSPEEDLAAASERKMDHICRKLLLQRGDRLLDLGCGWGSLSVHAAKRCGASVLGVTLSELQADFARRRAEEEGVSDRCQFEVMDFRELTRPEAFDKIAAVGIVEHVSAELQPEFFRRIARLLRPGGLCLNQGIVRSPQSSNLGGQDFIERYIFPGASLSTIGAMLTNAEGARLDIRDVESLSDHYVLTLRAWLRRLEATSEPAKRVTSEAHYRAFRAYLASFAYEFCHGDFRVYQTLLLQRGGEGTRLPLTRAHVGA